MILDFEDNPFTAEEELLSNNREPAHEQAVRALLADQPRLFLDLLVDNHMG
jgi:hypothetical protein